MKNFLLAVILLNSVQSFAARTECGDNLYELIHQRGPFINGKFQSPFKSPPPYKLSILSITREQEVDLKALAAQYKLPIDSVYRDYQLGLRLKAPFLASQQHNLVLDLLGLAYHLKMNLKDYVTSGGGSL